jgi:hypothetical protein
MQYACSLLHCHCVLSGFTVFFYGISHMVRFKKYMYIFKCVFPPSTIFVWNISHSNQNWAWYGQKRLLVFMQSTSYFCQILVKLNFMDRFSKNTHIWNFMKILPMGDELFHGDGREPRQIDRHTDMTNLIVAFCNFAEAPKIWVLRLEGRKFFLVFTFLSRSVRSNKK